MFLYNFKNAYVPDDFDCWQFSDDFANNQTKSVSNFGRHVVRYKLLSEPKVFFSNAFQMEFQAIAKAVTVSPHLPESKKLADLSDTRICVSY